MRYISTKDRIKKVALSQFAKKGYAGTSINDITSEVGIKKASLYNHYKGKEDLFLAVYEDLARNYEQLNETLFNKSDDMEFEERIRYLFEGYIIYYYQNPEIQAFWNQITLFTPSELRERFYIDIINRDNVFREPMEKIFEEGINKGVIRNDSPAKMVMSFRAMREGLLNWMMIIPDLKEEYIKDFWRDLWMGLSKGGKC